MNRQISVYLDGVRLAAALIVLLSHVSYRSLSDGQVAFLAPLGIQAVDIFFVVSGFVIAHVCGSRERTASSYALSRSVRIVSVALPALGATMLFDHIGGLRNPDVYLGEPYQPMTAGLLIRSVSFLGECWGAHRFPGSNGPYWSLGFEVWYYVAFGIFVFVPGRWRWLGVLATFAAIGPKVTAMFPVWLMGVATYRFCMMKRLPGSTGWLMLLTPVVAYILFQTSVPAGPQPFLALTYDRANVAGLAQHYVIGVFFSVHLIGFATVSAAFAGLLARLEWVIRQAAQATFSIYLVHLPTMFLLSAVTPFPRSSAAHLTWLIAGSLMTCFAFAWCFERRKDAWRRAFEGIYHQFTSLGRPS